MRPLQPETLSDREWGDYLFMRKNPRGVHHEQWHHAHGCRRWFKAQRDTVSYEFQGYQTFAGPRADIPEALAPEALAPEALAPEALASVVMAPVAPAPAAPEIGTKYDGGVV